MLKEPEKAADAYGARGKLKPDDPAILENEVDAMMADRKPTEPVPDRARVLKHLEALDADEPRALWYLGLAAAQAHQIDEAKAYWQRLLAVRSPRTRSHGAKELRSEPAGQPGLTHSQRLSGLFCP